MPAKLDPKNAKADCAQFEWWTCTLCTSWSWASQRNCRKCGAKKTYAAVATPLAGSPAVGTPVQLNPDQQSQIDALRDMLANIVPTAAVQSAASTPAAGSTTAPTPASAAATTPVAVQSEPSRADLNARIKSIEQALAFLPAADHAFADARAPLEAEKERLVQQIRDSAPIGLRINGCTQACTRAENRLKKAKARLEAAHAAMAVAQVEIVEAAKEVTSEEAGLSVKQRELQSLQETSGAGVSSLAVLESSMSRVLGDMAADGGVQRDQVDSAYALMSQLFSGLSSIAAARQITTANASLGGGADSMAAMAANNLARDAAMASNLAQQQQAAQQQALQSQNMAQQQAMQSQSVMQMLMANGVGATLPLAPQGPNVLQMLMANAATGTQSILHTAPPSAAPPPPPISAAPVDMDTDAAATNALPESPKNGEAGINDQDV